MIGTFRVDGMELRQSIKLVIHAYMIHRYRLSMIMNLCLVGGGVLKWILIVAVVHLL